MRISDWSSDVCSSDLTLADRIVVLNQGGIEQVGSPMDIYLTPRTEFVASFVGSPKINLLPVTVDPAGDRARARLPNGAIIDTAVATADLPTGAMTLGLRPECIRPAALDGAPLAARVHDRQSTRLHSSH